jgi:hypothetical protein
VLAARLLLVVSVIPTASCTLPADAPIAIEFTIVPPAGIGGSDKLAPIEGRVNGARRDQRIVLFTKTNMWWVQPLTVQPFTDIEANGSWKNTVHLGTEYAALLVNADYRPPATSEVLPQAGGPVIAIATVKGSGHFIQSSPKTLSFSGYEWEVRSIPSDRGGHNTYDAANAWTDPDGSLHLKLAHTEGTWTSAEVALTRALGYGTYMFTVRDTAHLDPAAAFGLLTWDDQGADQNHRELDIEISQWGDRSISNAQYVIQPYYVPANVVRFSAPSGLLTHSFRWEPGRASFRTFRGEGSSVPGALVRQHDFTSGVPTPGNERVRINLYYFRYSPAPPQSNVEVVIERFQYFP